MKKTRRPTLTILETLQKGNSPELHALRESDKLLAPNNSPVTPTRSHQEVAEEIPSAQVEEPAAIQVNVNHTINCCTIS